ncbi:hypothetical protein ACMD2_09349 [Ananas comosus]|uniref:Zinc finger PHD-type domain-containing protein n=1 Tax=Ananas comosus TaxID=4615 RepID=A0A199W1K7_ANACO|nr:hypothetical protein ACMD2_09349 [Ananas comosus]
MATAPPPVPSRVGCGGDGCCAREPWPLHHVRHRSVFCLLCTSCVLRYHHGLFCSSCFDLLDPPPSPPPPTTVAAAASAETLVHCSKCPSVAHRACLAAADLAAQFLCPSCKNPEGFSYLPVPDDPPKGKGSGQSDRPPINRPSAKVFLAAAQLSATSMSKAAAAARADAERKVKEAAVAKKRAREMLEGLLVIAKREEKMNGAKGSVTPIPVPAQEAAEPKKKAPRPSSTVSAQKKVQSREREKWMRFHEFPSVHRPVPGNSESDKSKGLSSISSMQNNVGVDSKDRVGSLSRLPKQAECQENEKKGLSLGSQGRIAVKEEDKGFLPDADKAPRIPQTIQDASIPVSNSRALLSGSPSTASLRL